ncbi:dTDP-4-dehydrorhamnose reductase [uncultured Aquimarina sp.]|uniref:dTDP-4-dehydrorhamnose reductase n=1 Tax=uncultured Aquimarina sp. TaxID=575652 RepID=UPI002601D74C|nr:dTDP-4-dehydrorhamnose reductase [uncultured Aquimarina sp.]
MPKNKINILVTGGDGQLGKSIKLLKSNYPDLDLCFTNSKELNITNKENIVLFFRNNSFDYVINCAAYTNVEQAEKEPNKAFLVNAEGVKNLAEICKETNKTLIHISTDYVFDGKKQTPYSEEDTPNPINEYGKSKLQGEKYIEEILKTYFIIRTSWLYSEYGHNFYKTILSLSKKENTLKITTSEKGTPTNANDLAKFILYLISIQNKDYGVYHFSNQGEATWYDFAKEIINNIGKDDTIRLEKTDNYHTFAERPKYSVLNKIKCNNTFNLYILNWKESLKNLSTKIK